MSWTLHLSLTPTYIQVSSVHLPHVCLELFTCHLHRHIVVFSVHPTHLSCLKLFTYHLHRYTVKCPPYIRRISLVLNSSLITYTDIKSSVLRTSNASLLSWTLHLSLTPIYSQVPSVHPTQLSCLELYTYHLHRYTVKCSPYIRRISCFELFTYHLHRYIVKCPSYIRRIPLVLNSSLITYTDI